jgi:hypothetical protein
VLTQIDNLTTGLTRAALSRPAPDVPSADEAPDYVLEAIRKRANVTLENGGDIWDSEWTVFQQSEAASDRATLLDLLDAARAELATVQGSHTLIAKELANINTELAEVREAVEVRAWRTSTRAKLPELYWGCEPHGPNKNEHALALWEMLRTALNPVAFPPRAALKDTQQ